MDGQTKRRPGRLRRAFVLVAGLTLAGATAEAGDAFLRAGVIFHPRDIGFEGRWRGAFGSDYAVNFDETLFIGFEVQTSVYRQDITDSDRTATIVPLNGFVNVKYKSGNIGLRPYAGGGLGMLSQAFILSGGNDWSSDFGFHVLGGVEFGAFNVELQIQRSFESGADTSYAVYGGFVF